MRHFSFPLSRGFALLLWLALASPLFAQPNRDFSKEPARPAPAWVRDAVVYEVFPRQFSPAGNFAGVTARLDELKALGVDVLWLMPIHPVGRVKAKGSVGSPYAVQDFYAINPDYGTKEDFRQLVDAAHARGLKVIIDIVANHTAWDSVMLTNRLFYKRNAAGEVIPPNPDWSDVAGLDYTNPDTRRYMIAMLAYWLREFRLDGFRCDVAYEVPTSFWEEARPALEAIKPDVFLLAEASHPDLLVKAFDADYAWPMHGTLNRVLMEGAPASEFQRTWEEERQKFPTGSLHLRFTDNHDEARAISRFGWPAALAASVMMFTLDGVPLLYNGMEVGDTTESGAPALFEKLPVFWQPKQRESFRETYRQLIAWRKQYPALRNDRVIWLKNSDAQNLVTFLRLDSRDEIVVVVNFSNRPQTGWLEVMHSEDFQPLTVGTKPSPAAKGFPLFALAPFEWRLYHRTVPR